ncbi:hypothetical protein [Pontibacter harenae]|uniref:hypothetical protein n=1 Tax=Pontibacter harenae TaxID=2894083 RepID=UPI001E659591|nr:hypothetical protein [Pontibacter harenae]MCC9165830.1 hypothetical protein [Pontibacter harenae]
MNNEQNKNQQSDLTDKNKDTKNDITNSLERDAVGKSGSRNQTPQNRTDNEQDAERKKQ